VTPGLMADQPLALRRPATGPDHLGVGAGLVDENQLLSRQGALRRLPRLASPRYVRPHLFGRLQTFF